MLFLLRRIPTVSVQRTVAAIFPARLKTTKAAASASRIVDASKARQLLESKEAKFIDVRAPESYSEGHIPTAANVHTFFTYLPTSDDRGVRDLTDTFTEELRNAGIYGNEHVVTYENSLNTLYGASCRALYILRLLAKVFFGPIGEPWKDQTDASRLEGFSMAALAGFVLLVGLFPFPFIRVIDTGVAELLATVAASG